jgi:carbonic anhydrase/acetyltransferase-like protein (isoleucine patch superfamily)
MLIEHLGKQPRVAETAYIAPTATLCGDVIVGEGCRVLFGAVLVAEGGPIVLGRSCIIMENAVIRGTTRHPTMLSDHILVGPRAYLSGCTVESNVFLAAGSTVFNGAVIGSRTVVRVNGVVHIKTVLPADSTVPIGWVAIGDPVAILPPNEHEKIWTIQEPLNFPRTVFGLERPPVGETNMPELTRRYGHYLGQHRNDRILDTGEPDELD